MDSVKSIYKIGFGPSSSHTMGPGYAAEIFKQRYPDADKITVTLYGSLGATGKGHMTDKALLRVLSPVETEILWRPDIVPDFHTNGMLFEAFGSKGEKIGEWTVYSIGGGYLSEGPGENSISNRQYYRRSSMNEIQKFIQQEGLSFWEYVEYHEDADFWEYLGKVWEAMQQSVRYKLQKPEKGSVEADIYDQDNTGKITGMKTGWNHFAMAFNQRAIKVYINGKRVINAPNVIAPKYVEFCYYNCNDYPYCCLSNIRLGTAGAELYERNASDLTAVEKSMQETGKFVTNNIHFETGKATLKPESMADIQAVADYMKKNPSVRFEVQGHCDNQGSDKVNDPLSQQRAEAIVAELVKLGVDEWNLRAVGKGSHEPVADNSTETGRAQNRRVEFIKK